MSFTGRLGSGLWTKCPGSGPRAGGQAQSRRIFKPLTRGNRDFASDPVGGRMSCLPGDGMTAA